MAIAEKNAISALVTVSDRRFEDFLAPGLSALMFAIAGAGFVISAFSLCCGGDC